MEGEREHSGQCEETASISLSLCEGPNMARV